MIDYRRLALLVTGSRQTRGHPGAIRWAERLAKANRERTDPRCRNCPEGPLTRELRVVRFLAFALPAPNWEGRHLRELNPRVDDCFRIRCAVGSKNCFSLT